jgi:F-type H+-transporting ATPase subunit delta
MVTGSLARRYARAVLEIGLSQGNLDKLGADLRSLAAAMKTSAELVGVLTNPGFRRTERKKIVDALLDRIAAQPASRNVTHLLLDGERMASLPAISRELDAMIEARSGRVTAEVVSATPLTPDQLTQITAQLEKLSGKQVVIQKREDPALLGGVVAKVGDTVYDGSLRTQLRSLRDQVAKQ